MFNLLFRFDNILHATLGRGQHLSFLSLWIDIWGCVQQGLGTEGVFINLFKLMRPMEHVISILCAGMKIRCLFVTDLLSLCYLCVIQSSFCKGQMN